MADTGRAGVTAKAGFSSRLKSMSFPMWLGLIGLTVVGSLILMTFILALTLGTLNVIQQITHYVGW